MADVEFSWTMRGSFRLSSELVEQLRGDVTDYHMRDVCDLLSEETSIWITSLNDLDVDDIEVECFDDADIGPLPAA